jgi:hypothetical protein
LVSISNPDPESGLTLPEKGERLQILGDVSDVVSDPKVQKALKRLAADKAPATISQIVMWRLGSGLDWDLIAQLSQKWANRYEMSLAKDFVNRLDILPADENGRPLETGRLLFSVEATDSEREPLAGEIAKSIDGKTVLGLIAQIGVPARPEVPAVACRIRLTASDALVMVSSSDPTAANWVPLGKFTLPLAKDKPKVDIDKFNGGLVEGILNRLVRAQLIKDSATKAKNKLIYQLRIENASPLVLNGVALLGTASKPDAVPQILCGFCLPPRKKMTYPASDDIVKSLGLKKGTKVVALDLSGL